MATNSNVSDPLTIGNSSSGALEVEAIASSRRRHRRTPPSVDEKALLRHRSADVAGTRSNQRPPRVRKRASSHRLSESGDPTVADHKTVSNAHDPNVVPLVSRHSRKPLNAASSGSSDSSLSMKASGPTPMPPPALMRGRQGGSDENVLVEETSPAAPAVDQQSSSAAAPAVAATLPAKGSAATARRNSAVLSERLNHDDEYRSATTSETTRDGGEAAVLAASSASLEEDGSLLVSPNGSFILSRSKSRDSGSPLPNSGDSIAVDADTRLWFGDLSRMERIVSFQRSSSGRHGISQTSSGLLIRHPLVLTGPSPSKDDDSSAGTLNTDSNQQSSLSTSASNAVPNASKQDSARKVLSFGSSPSSSDVEPRRTTTRTKRRHHRTRRPAAHAPIIQSSKSLHDVLSAVGATGDVPESLIVRVLSPTHIGALDGHAISDALSSDDDSSESTTSLDSSDTSSNTQRAPAEHPVRTTLTPPVEQSPKRRLSPLSPPVSPAPRTPSPQAQVASSSSNKTSPTAAAAAAAAAVDMTHVTVNDRRERIISMKTSKSGRHTITQTETGKVITQPVFFSPGGVVMTESVPIYEAEEATTIASVAARTSAHRVRGRNSPALATSAAQGGSSSALKAEE